MKSKSLKRLYKEHQGKVSDKWSLYLSEYEGLFEAYRSKEISILEIGIQNGGSLEIYGKYFSNARKIVGCDIDPACSALTFDDSRITVIVGNANSSDVEHKIIEMAPSFDLIIDDGSHLSSDIVCSFARYFAHLHEGGLYIVEDLHCSYWQEFAGGLFNPYAALSFFKRLTDIINHEHWGVNKTRTELLASFTKHFGIDFNEDLLAQIHSIEFVNSMCVLRKNQAKFNVLGKQFIAGNIELVCEGRKELHGQFATSLDQSENPWTDYSAPVEELVVEQNGQISRLEQTIIERDVRIDSLNQTLNERDAQVASLNQTLNERDAQVASLNQTLNERDARVASFGQVLHDRDIQIASLNQALNERDAQVASFGQALHDRDIQIASLNQALNERDAQVASLGQALHDRDIQIASLNQALNDRDAQVASLRQIVDAYQNSTSWRLTKPVRFVGKKIKQIRRFLVLSGVLFSNVKEIKNVAIKLRKMALANVEYHLKLLQSEEYVAQVARNRGLSPEFLRALIILGSVFLQIKRWWFANNLRREYSTRLATFFHGETSESRKIELSHLRLHVDNPRGLLKIIVDDTFVISGWCVDLDASVAAKVRVRIGKVVHQPYPKQREEVQGVFASVCELPLDVGFAAVPSLSMGLHRMWVDIQGPHSTWIPVRRALLLCLPGMMRGQQTRSLSYKAWAHIEQKLLKAEFPEIKRHIDVMLHKPIFTVVIDMRQSLNGWKESLQSIRKQIYPHYELRVLVNMGVELPTTLKKDANPLQDTSLTDVLGNFIVFIESGQSLSANALYEFANALNQNPDLDLVYGDEDRLSASGERCTPFYKPDWSPDYLETFNYIGFPMCFRTTIASGFFNNTHLYDLALRFTECTTKIWHVAKILGHEAERKVDDEVLKRVSACNIAALEGRLRRTGRQGTVREHELHRGCYDIELNLKRKPLVSIIIPTTGKTVTVAGRQIDLITNVIDQIRNQSTYKNIEIIVIDNGDLSARQQQVLTDQGCRRITYTEPVFNIPKKLNLGASITNGELLLLMNDDIEILTPSWIERMVEHFEKPHVGVVGVKLLCPDGRTQHVGVVHNYGNPEPVRRLFPGDEAGYYFSTCGVRNFMAVTGAVMMTSSNIYREVGGYSEELAVSFNDTDYCLKVHEKGLRIVYAPGVVLTHMESQSHVASADMCEVMWYHKRWAPKIVSDPYYNEQFLTVAPPTFVPHVNRRLL